MRINYIQLSNILSFKHYPDVALAPKISFDNGLNILIGQNGSGKSTALEVINFIFKKVIFAHYNVNHDEYSRRSTLDSNNRRNILRNLNNTSYNHFRLDPNWDTANEAQKIIIQITLDDIDKKNLKLLESNKTKLQHVAGIYSSLSLSNFDYTKEFYSIEVTLNKTNNSFAVAGDTTDLGYQYLVQYNYYKELINLHNQENPKDQLPSLQDSFTLIGSYRNYNAFSPSVSLANQASTQIQQLKDNEVAKSSNANDQAEPSVFNLVRLRIADKHHNLVFTDKNADQATSLANEEPFLQSINKKLSLINLKVKITLQNRNTWAYSFSFHDIKSDRVLADINSLSAGQKSIIHLIFEAYGRGDLKGGVVIIDEPEIHLHYQYQYEYLRIIEQLNAEQNCQYILVTHSEALISSETIDKVKRFSLDENKNTIISSPQSTADQKTLIKILDNTRSTYAFFAKKVVLVEGDSDRYFFKSVFQTMKPELNQEIAIIDIGGKGNFDNWKSFFTEFGLKVYLIGDFDNVVTLNFPTTGRFVTETEWNTALQNKLNNLTVEQKGKLRSLYDELIADTNFLVNPSKLLWDNLLNCYEGFLDEAKKDIIADIKLSKTDIEAKIEAQYANKIYILKKGALEDYTKVGKKLSSLIPFCEEIKQWLSTPNEYTDEIRAIVESITQN